MARLRIALMLALLVPVTLTLMGVQALALRFGWRLAHRLPMHFHRFVCRMFRVGDPDAGRAGRERARCW